MKHPSFFATILFLVGPLACSSSTTIDTTAAPIASCFDTGGGHMRCVPTPQGAAKEPRDVDGDGKADTFVCAVHPKSKLEHADAARGDVATRKGDGGRGAEKGEHDDDDDCGKLGCRDLRKHRDDDDDHAVRKADDDDQSRDRDGRDAGVQKDVEDGGGRKDARASKSKGDHDADDMICPSRDAGAKEDGAG
jgi:hypothetical protein